MPWGQIVCSEFVARHVNLTQCTLDAHLDQGVYGALHGSRQLWMGRFKACKVCLQAAAQQTITPVRLIARLVQEFADVFTQIVEHCTCVIIDRLGMLEFVV